MRAPLIEAQIPETFLLATIGFQSMIAAKAVRVVERGAGTVGGRVRFATRTWSRGRSLGGPCSLYRGVHGTSNVEAGFRYGIPVFGTCAHSWVLSFAEESEAFRTPAGVARARYSLPDRHVTIRLREHEGEPSLLASRLWGVRLDSGDLCALSEEVRAILDERRACTMRRSWPPAI